MPGPPPKRDAERRRRNKPDVETTTVNLAETVTQEVTIPVADPAWHRIAIMIWESLPRSGQAMFYEPSDWAAAYLMCESISRDLEEQVVGITEAGEVVRAEIPMKGASLSAYLKQMGALLMSEAERRRAKMEIERANAGAIPKGDLPAGVTSITKNREDVFRRAEA